MITLYGYGRSRWIKPFWTLKELGVPFQAELIRPDKIHTDFPEFLKINPFAKIPALKDGDFTLFESCAICTYLADKFSEKELIPKAGTRSRARYDQWISFMTTDLEQPLWRIAKHTFAYPEEKRSKADIDLAKEDFLKVGKVLESQISDYVVDGKFTVADIVMTYTLNWASGYNLLDHLPNLKAYVARHMMREAFPRELFNK